MIEPDPAEEIRQLRALHSNNVKAIFTAVDAVIEISKDDSKFSKGAVLSITSKLLSDMKITWEESEASNE